MKHLWKLDVNIEAQKLLLIELKKEVSKSICDIMKHWGQFEQTDLKNLYYLRSDINKRYHDLSSKN